MESSFGALAHLSRGEQHFRAGPQSVFGFDTLHLLQPHGNEEPQDEDSDTEPDSGCDIQAAHVDGPISFWPSRPARVTRPPSSSTDISPRTDSSGRSIMTFLNLRPRFAGLDR